MVSTELALSTGYDPARVEERIQAFEDLGIHRTGWPADDQTTQWLIDELAEAGVDAQAERFAFPRVEVARAEVRVGGERIEGVPLYDGGFTDAGGIDGELCDDTDDDPLGKIVLASSLLRDAPEWSEPELPVRIEELIDRGCVGLIVPRGDRDREIVLRDATRIDSPWLLPVLQIAPRDIGTLQSQIMIRGEVDLEINGDRLRSNATNVIATVEGVDPDAAPIGIVTPKSGWYTCAAERGGGIAIFLALAESLGAMPPRRTVHLLASSGHELNIYGIRAYARTHRANMAAAAAWFHLGASIGAREANAVVVASDEELDHATSRALTAEQIEPVERRVPGPTAGGEVIVISELVTRYVSFIGGHPYLHSPNDVVAKVVDAEQVASWARASRHILGALLALEGEED